MDQPPAIIIQDDRGGNVGDYIARVAAARKSGARVEIIGSCASACTIWTSFPPERICAGTHASLGFHKTTPDLGDLVLTAFYPQKVNAWLTERGGLSRDLKWLFGSNLRAIIKLCSR